jgi:LuxR family maltose regulon positive regulatory protein
VLQLAPQDRPLPKPFEPIVRERLIEHLRSNAANKVTLVAAPAGFGKTVAVQQYLRACNVDHMRFSLRREHGTLLGFVRGFAKAIAPFAPHAAQHVATVWAEAEKTAAAPTHLAAWLAALLEGFTGTIVVDDLHRISDEPHVVEMFADVVERSPDATRWIIVTRAFLGLPIASWLAYGTAGIPIEESNLRLTLPEATQIAASLDRQLGATEIHELITLTQAWPAAFAFALQASTRAMDLKHIVDGTREMVYAFLAEQVLRNLDAAERKFLFDTALLPTLEIDLLEAAGCRKASEMLDRVRRSTAFVFSEGSRVFRYHDLFRDFLEHELKKQGVETYQRACAAAGTLLSDTGHRADALSLFARSGLDDESVEVLRRVGFELVDEGHCDIVELALVALPVERRNSDAALLGVTAAVDAFRARYTRADNMYRRSLSVASDTSTYVEIVLRYVSFLTYPAQRYLEAQSVLKTISEVDLPNPRAAARFFARKAKILSFLGHVEGVRELAQRAMTAADQSNDDVLRTITWNDAAMVALNSGRPKDGQALGRQAAIYASRSGFPIFLTSACCSLVQGAYEQGDYLGCHRELAKMRELSERFGYAAGLWFCLVVEYDLAVQRADDERLHELEQRLLSETPNVPESHAGLTSAFALRKASCGEFRAAYAIIQEFCRSDCPNSDKTLMSSDRLLYASAAGMNGEAVRAFEETMKALNPKDGSQSLSFINSRARAHLALGALLIGRVGHAHNALRFLERGFDRIPPAVVELTRAIRALYIRWETNSCDDELAGSLARLSSTPLAAYAQIIARVSRPEKSNESIFCRLTKTELQTLRLLSEGATSRDVAAATGRSVLTVDAHVKALTRKLRCSGRREAIALARAHGII